MQNGSGLCVRKGNEHMKSDLSEMFVIETVPVLRSSTFASSMAFQIDI